jgi:helix-turn-helix protein
MYDHSKNARCRIEFSHWRGAPMSIGIQSLIWKAGPASKAELLLLLAIADHAEDEGHAFPGVALLAKKSRDTTRNVLRVLPKLVAGGWVSVDAHQGRSSEYHIALRKVISVALASGDKLSPEEKRIVALHRDKLSPVERATHDITGDQPMTLRDQSPDISGSLY